VRGEVKDQLEKTKLTYPLTASIFAICLCIARIVVTHSRVFNQASAAQGFLLSRGFSLHKLSSHSVENKG
jgi:hypothetical protein